jgi:hypothetical protein
MLRGMASAQPLNSPCRLFLTLPEAKQITCRHGKIDVNDPLRQRLSLDFFILSAPPSNVVTIACM